MEMWVNTCTKRRFLAFKVKLVEVAATVITFVPIVLTFTPVYSGGNSSFFLHLCCCDTSSLCFAPPPPGGDFKSIACGRLYLSTVYPEALHHFYEMSSLVFFLVWRQSPIFSRGLHFNFGMQVETEGECPGCLRRVRTFSSLTCSVFR